MAITMLNMQLVGLKFKLYNFGLEWTKELIRKLKKLTTHKMNL